MECAMIDSARHAYSKIAICSGALCQRIANFVREVLLLRRSSATSSATITAPSAAVSTASSAVAILLGGRPDRLFLLEPDLAHDDDQSAKSATQS